MVKMCIRIKGHLPTILAGLLSVLVLFFDVVSVSAFNGFGGHSGAPLAFNGGGPDNGRPSGPSPYRRGGGYQRSNPGPGNYGPGQPPRYYRGDRGPGYYRGGSGPGNYGNGRGPRSYRGQPFSPYGGPRRGGYGERRAVQSRGDAQRMLNNYYGGRNMRIGPIRDNGFYFEADILDRNNRFMDRVIIDKRSGRIRSIY